MTDEKPARRTRPAVRPTCADSSAPAAVDPADDLDGAVSEQPPGLGQSDTPADTLQQLRPGLGLQPREVMADGRLGVVELGSGRGDRPEPRDRLQNPQARDVQHASMLSMCRPSAAGFQSHYRPRTSPRGRHAGAGRHEHVLDAVDLVDRGAAELTHALGDAVHAVDVRLAELPAVRVEREPAADLDRAVGDEVLAPRRGRRSRAPRAA